MLKFLSIKIINIHLYKKLKNNHSVFSQWVVHNMTNEQIREHLLKKGVSNMVEFGYPNVTTENILTDKVYSLIFKNMLNENLGTNDKIDEVINQLLSEIK